MSTTHRAEMTRSRGTPLAHAELNALAAISTDVDLAACVLYTTHEPCAMCAAAIEFPGLGEVRFLASDPSSGVDGEAYSSGHSASVWVVVANALFLHNVARVAGESSEIVEHHAGAEPETVGLAMELLQSGSLVETGDASSLGAVLGRHWRSIESAAAARNARLNRTTRGGRGDS